MICDICSKETDHITERKTMQVVEDDRRRFVTYHLCDQCDKKWMARLNWMKENRLKLL